MARIPTGAALRRLVDYPSTWTCSRVADELNDGLDAKLLPSLVPRSKTTKQAQSRNTGYARVSIRDITSSVDVPKGAFYNHFKSKEALASAVLAEHFNALLETLREGGNGAAGSRFGRHVESLVPSTQKPTASPLLLISTLAAEGPSLPITLAEQIAEGVRVWSNQVAALISLAQAEGQINAEVEPNLLAALFINCWQGATIRTKCDPAAPCDCLRFALDRVLEA